MCVTIFSTGGKFHPVSIFTYIVTRSYSSHPFLCTLDASNGIIAHEPSLIEQHFFKIEFDLTVKCLI